MTRQAKQQSWRIIVGPAQGVDVVMIKEPFLPPMVLMREEISGGIGRVVDPFVIQERLLSVDEHFGLATAAVMVDDEPFLVGRKQDRRGTVIREKHVMLGRIGGRNQPDLGGVLEGRVALDEHVTQR